MTVLKNKTDKTAVRDVRSDLLKAISIFGVVFIHIPIDDGIGASFYFRFSVPLFIAIWALYFNLGLEKRVASQSKSYYMARIFKILIPYIFWTVFYVILYHNSISDWRETPIHTIIGGWFGGYGWSGQFFIIVLLQLVVIFAALRKIGDLKGVIAICIGSGLVIVAAEWIFWRIPFVSGIGDRFFIYWIAYCVLGIAISRNLIPHISSAILIPMALFFLSLSSFEYRIAYSDVFRPSPYLLGSVFLGSICVILLLASPVRRTAGHQGMAIGRDHDKRNFLFLDCFKVVRQFTFPIFLMNPFIIGLFPWSLVRHWNGEVFEFLLRFASASIVVVACLILGLLFQKLGLGILVGLESRSFLPRSRTSSNE